MKVGRFTLVELLLAAILIILILHWQGWFVID